MLSSVDVALHGWTGLMPAERLTHGRLCERSDPRVHRFDLRRIPCVIAEARVAPPVPAGLRIERSRRRLREKHNDIVGLRPIGETRFVSYRIANVVFRLTAAVKDNMHSATVVLPASFRDVGDALGREICLVTRVMALIEGDELVASALPLGDRVP